MHSVLSCSDLKRSYFNLLCVLLRQTGFDVTSSSYSAFDGVASNVTVHEKTRYIGHFGGNEALTELIRMQTAE